MATTDDEVCIRVDSEHLDSLLAAYRLIGAIAEVSPLNRTYTQTLDDLDELIGRVRYEMLRSTP